MRKKALLLNTLSSILNMIITLICGFVLPRFILKGFGSEVNGLVSSIGQFLSFITFLDMGVGAVVQSSFYKPLAKNDRDSISLLYVSSKRFFRRLAYVLCIYIIILCCIYPVTIKSRFSIVEIDALIIITAIGLFAQYFLSVSDQLLLNADQKLYIQTGVQAATVVINTVLSIVLIYAGASIQIVKLFSSIVFLTRPIFYCFYVKKNYDIDRKIDITGYKIEQKWNGLAQHVATVIMNNTDIMVLTIMAHISTVSVYSVYAMVTNGIKQFINALSNGFFSLLGDLYAREERKKLQDTFAIFQWGINAITVFFYSIALLLIVPFVKLYTNGVTDADYYQPLFAYILIAGQAIFCLRIPYNTMICSAGHYKQTQNSAIIEAVINVLLSIFLVLNFGLIGVAIGTLVAISYRTYSFCCYLNKNIIQYRYIDVFKQYSVDIIEMVIILIGGMSLLSWLPDINNTVSFVFSGVVLSCFAFFVLILINMLFFKKEIHFLMGLILKRIKRGSVVF